MRPNIFGGTSAGVDLHGWRANRRLFGGLVVFMAIRRNMFVINNIQDIIKPTGNLRFPGGISTPPFG